MGLHFLPAPPMTAPQPDAGEVAAIVGKLTKAQKKKK